MSEENKENTTVITSDEDKQNAEMTAKINDVLDRLRPFLQREGGDIKLNHFDSSTGICYVEMVGACNGCYMAASDVSDSVEVLLMDEIPEIKKVELVQPEAMSFEDLLKRLQAEEQANRELEEYNKAHPNNSSSNDTPSEDKTK